MTVEPERPPLWVIVARAMVSLAPAIGVQLALDRLLRISPLAALVVGIVCGAGCFVWLSRAGRGS